MNQFSTGVAIGFADARYDDDFLAWSEQQARLLVYCVKRIKAYSAWCERA